MKTSTVVNGRHFQLLVVGGGAGGLGTASKFGRKLKNGAVGIVEPNENHYYQPGFTLVGGGLMTLDANRKRQKDLIPKNTTWIQDKVVEFVPSENLVKLRDGTEITYDYLMIAMGISLRFDLIKGGIEALKTPEVSSNYSPFFVEKTFKNAMNFQSGNAVFTFPNMPIKCAGAPQKACYITESILQNRGVRKNANVIYATSLGKLFGIESYLKSLEKIAKEKNIDVRTRRNLIEIKPEKKIAVFENLDIPGKTEEIDYSMLHIGPPCSTPKALYNAKRLVDTSGFLDVDPRTLQSKGYPNIFGVGDCINTPNAKTAAAVSSHLKTVEKNLEQVMKGKNCILEYDGYASCPLVVSTNRVILAEFNSNGPMETTPFNQTKPTYWAYLMKRYFMPFLYWHGLIKGYWNGPANIRKFSNFFKNKC